MQCRDNQHIQKFNPIQFGIFMVLLASIHVFMSNKTLYMGIFGSTENKIKFSNSPKKKKKKKKWKKKGKKAYLLIKMMWGKTFDIS